MPEPAASGGLAGRRSWLRARRDPEGGRPRRPPRSRSLTTAGASLRPVTNQNSRWVAAAAQWLPRGAVLAYAALLVSGLRRVLGAVYASSDAASPPMIAACLARRCAS